MPVWEKVRPVGDGAGDRLFLLVAEGCFRHLVEAVEPGISAAHVNVEGRGEESGHGIGDVKLRCQKVARKMCRYLAAFGILDAFADYRSNFIKLRQAVRQNAFQLKLVESQGLQKCLLQLVGSHETVTAVFRLFEMI